MKQPNILMICSDQHAARVTGAYGNRIVATPNLDKLAAEGCRFDSFYCNDPICVPSRMSLMTGRFPFRCEVTGNQSVLDSRFPTLAHIAVRGGWHAVLSGKMHFNGSDQRHGFLERLVGEPSTNALYGGANRGHEGPPFCHLGNCSRPDPLFHVGAGVNPFVAYDGAVTEATVRWLRQYATGAGTRTVPPFFLMVGFLLPHCPYIAPKELYEKYRAKVKAPRLTCAELDALHLHHRAYRKFIRLDDVPPENFDKAAAAYYGLVDQLDRNVGAVLDALQELGLLENTIVMYFSDHGEMLGRAWPVAQGLFPRGSRAGADVRASPFATACQFGVGALFAGGLDANIVRVGRCQTASGYGRRIVGAPAERHADRYREDGQSGDVRLLGSWRLDRDQQPHGAPGPVEALLLWRLRDGRTIQFG